MGLLGLISHINYNMDVIIFFWGGGGGAFCVPFRSKIFFSRTSGPISITQHPWVKGIYFAQMKGYAFFQEKIITKWQLYIDNI